MRIPKAHAIRPTRAFHGIIGAMQSAVDVLIVDDEQHTREGIRDELEWSKHGMRVIGTAANAYEALDIMDRSLPHIVILDIKMPDMDGLELLEIVKCRYPNVRVILISGYDQFSYAQKAVSGGAFCYILKPIDERELTEKILDARREIVEEQHRIHEDEVLRTRYRENLPVLRDHFLGMLASGRPLRPDRLIEKGEALGIDLSGKDFVVVAFDPSEERDEMVDQSAYRRYSVMEKAERILCEISDTRDPVHCYAFNVDKHIALLVAGDSIDIDAILASTGEIRTWVNVNLGVSVTASIGTVVHNPQDIHVSAKNAIEGLEYRFVKGSNSVFLGSDLSFGMEGRALVRRFERTLKELKPAAEKAVKSGDGIEDLVESIVAELARAVEKDLSCKSDLCFVLVVFVLELLISIRADLSFFFVDGIDMVSYLKAIAVREELQSFLLEYLCGLHSSWNDHVSSSNNRLVTRALRYMEENIHGDISLTRVAEELNVHPNYLSRIFKTSSGRTYIEREIEMKMNEARRMLEETDGRVYEIANALSYRDVNYFTRTFKRMVGVSPTEYRSIHS